MRRYIIKRPNYVIRLMTNKGLYPKTSFLHKDALYIVDRFNACIYSIVRLNRYDKQKCEGETGWAYPSEIKLWAAITLSYSEYDGNICIYPSWQNAFLSKEFREKDFRNREFLNKIHDLFRLKLSGLHTYQEQYDYLNLQKHQYKPKMRILKRIYDAIDIKDGLMIRGLSYLLKAKMISNNYIYTEEAALLTFISLNAALDLLRNKLVVMGIKKPTYKDAQKYLEDHVGFGEGYAELLEMSWEQRIMLVHPLSKYGILKMGGIFADDFFDMYDELKTIYRYLLTGEKRPMPKPVKTVRHRRSKLPVFYK